MKKVKFEIKGMDCKSCVLLIEEKLKNLPGVIKAKISRESEKGIVIYDENATEEIKIQSEIEKTGEYVVKKIGNEEESAKKIEKEEDEKKENYSSQNLSIPISIIIAGLIIAGAIILNSGKIDIGKIFNTVKQTKQTAQVLPDSNSNSQNQLPQDKQAKAETFNITEDSHIRGSLNAPITLVEFSDFECPFCAKHYPTLKKILDDYNGKVKLVYKHFPLSFHPNSQKAAESSECANEQGKFWEYHDKMFESLSASSYSIANFKQWAKDLGLNTKKFNDCLDSDKYAQKVQIDLQEGKEKGVNGTPATFINGQLVSGALPYDSFKQTIDSLLNQ